MENGGDLSPAVESICRLAERAHARYDGAVWQALPGSSVSLSNGQLTYPSYHNEHHVRAVIACARAAFAARAESDPFDLAGGLALWNGKLHDPSAAVDPAHLEFCLITAFALHDVGNISKNGLISLDGFPDTVLELRHAIHYDSSTLYVRPEVEFRSAVIADQVLAQVLKDEPLARRLSPLVHHLILQTIFHFEKVTSDELFWLFMQTIDMVGSYFFSPVPRRVAVAGLFNEMRVQKPGTISIYPFLTSLQYRFQRLFPDPVQREQVLQIFESNHFGQTRHKVFAAPPKKAELIEPMPFEDAIRILIEDQSLEHLD